MKDFAIWLNIIFVFIGAILVLFMFGLPEETVNKEKCIIALSIWLYILFNFIALIKSNINR